jgi:hypothetical protein
MAVRTISATGGQWSVATAWVEGVVPTSDDDVVANASSGAITIGAAGIACRSLNLTGYTKAVTHAASYPLTIGNGTAPPGNAAVIIPATGVTYSPPATAVIALVGDSGTVKTCDFGGRTLGVLTVDTAPGTTHRLVTNHMSAATLNLLNGAHLDLNDRNITTVMTVNLNSAAATLSLGSGTHTVTGSWLAPSGAVNAGTSTLVVNAVTDMQVNSGQNYGAVNWTWTTGTATRTVTGGRLNAASLTVNGFTQLNFSHGATVSGLCTLTSNGATQWLRVESATNGIPILLSAGSVSLSRVNFQDVTAGGAATWAGFALGNAGGNTGITFDAPATRYWVGGGGAWDSTTTHWSATSGGAAGASSPLVHDTAIFDANSGLGAGQSIIPSTTWVQLPSIDMSTLPASATFAPGSVPRSYYGSFILPTALITFTSSQPATFQGRGNHVITSNGRTMGVSYLIVIDAPGGTYTFTDNYTATSTGYLQLVQGTLTALANVTLGSPSSFAGFSTPGDGPGDRVLNMGPGTWTFPGIGTQLDLTTTGGSLTVNAEASTLAFVAAGGATSRALNGGGHTFNDLSISGATSGTMDIYGDNTFRTISCTANRTIRFASGSTTTFTGGFNFPAVASNIVTITSTAAGTHTLTKSAGVVSTDYISLTNSVATGDANWFAGSHSTNVSGNSGWIFNDPVVKFTPRAGAYNTSNFTSYVTATFAPSAGILLVAFVETSHTTDAPVPTLTSPHATWTLRTTLTSPGSTTDGLSRKFCLYTGVVNAAPIAAGVTINCGSTTATGCAWGIVEASGVRVNDPIARTVTGNTTGNPQSQTLSLPPQSSAGNRPIAGFTNPWGYLTSVTEANWTKGYEVTGTGPATTLTVLYNAVEFDPTPTATWATAGDSGGIAVELTEILAKLNALGTSGGTTALAATGAGGKQAKGGPTGTTLTVLFTRTGRKNARGTLATSATSAVSGTGGKGTEAHSGRAGTTNASGGSTYGVANRRGKLAMTATVTATAIGVAKQPVTGSATVTAAVAATSTAWRGAYGTLATDAGALAIRGSGSRSQNARTGTLSVVVAEALLTSSAVTERFSEWAITDLQLVVTTPGGSGRFGFVATLLDSDGSTRGYGFRQWVPAEELGYTPPIWLQV